MDLLLDSNVPQWLVPPLVAQGHQVEHCNTWAEDPGDDEIIRLACESRQVLLTLDTDITSIIMLDPGARHHGILRLPYITRQALIALALEALDQHRAMLEAGYGVIAEPSLARYIAPWVTRWGKE